MNKHALRVQLKSIRNAVPADSWQKLSTEIQTNAIQLLEEIALKSVLIYLESLKSREIQTNQILEHCQIRGILTTVPVTNNTEWIHPSVIGEHTKFQPDKWGIPTPTEQMLIPGEQIDVAIVPMLGGDRSGYRIGYGKGYYDRFLARFPHITTIGLCPSLAVFEQIPCEEHDIPLNYIVTEELTLRIA